MKYKIFAVIILGIIYSQSVFSQEQYKEYKIGPNGDTINAVRKDGKKVGKWVIKVEELRGEPGYEEEGIYKNGEKDGYWRKYNAQGDLIGVEHFLLGGKDGLQQYFTYLGDLIREENWKGYNPDAPYDTVAVYGTDNNEVLEFKLVKAEPYSVKNGEWRYYEAGSGRLIKVEQWANNNLVKPNEPKKEVADNGKKKEVEKTAEMLEWERKNKNKKKALREGRTGM